MCLWEEADLRGKVLLVLLFISEAAFILLAAGYNPLTLTKLKAEPDSTNYSAKSTVGLTKLADKTNESVTMNQRIYKYKLKITDIQCVSLPEGAELLSVGNQNGNLCLWARVDPDRPEETLTIEIIGTGNPIPEAKRSFIGTVIIDPFVWHVYERLSL